MKGLLPVNISTASFLRPFFLTVYMVLLQSFFLNSGVQARPEFAVRHGFTSCTACHVSPSGGGPRNITGKAFGLNGYAPGPYSGQDVWSIDARGLFYYPEKPTVDRGGLGLMAGIVSANLPITSNEEGKAKLRAVLSHNIGGYPVGAGSPRETFLRWEFDRESKTSLLPQHIILGRFVPPFGLVTDEHRTYTKLQTKSTWNDLDAGVMFSGAPLSFLHYDLALVNGQKTAGAGMGVGDANVWGGVLNLRFLSPSLPVSFGLSGLHYEEGPGKESPSASSMYVLVNLKKLSSGFINAVLLAEYVVAQGWNSTINGFFTDPNYKATVAESESRGVYAFLNLKITQKLSFIYKYDEFSPNQSFPSDYYSRHGLGFKYYLGPNVFAQARWEKAHATHPSEDNGTGMGSEGATWAYLQMSI